CANERRDLAERWKSPRFPGKGRPLHSECRWAAEVGSQLTGSGSESRATGPERLVMLLVPATPTRTRRRRLVRANVHSAWKIRFAKRRSKVAGPESKRQACDSVDQRCSHSGPAEGPLRICDVE